MYTASLALLRYCSLRVLEAQPLTTSALRRSLSVSKPVQTEKKGFIENSPLLWAIRDKFNLCIKAKERAFFKLSCDRIPS